MLLATDLLDEEGLALQTVSAYSLTETLYRTYMHPLTQDSGLRRVVVLRDSAQPALLARYSDQARSFLSPDDLGAVLLDLLVVDGERVGEVVYDCEPEPSDYVLVPAGGGYRLAPPSRRLTLRKKTRTRAA